MNPSQAMLPGTIELRSAHALPAKFATAALASIVLTIAFCATTASVQHRVTLAWTASPDAAANPSLTYNVYRQTSCSGAFERQNLTGIAATSFLDGSVVPGTYCYEVTAVLAGVESVPTSVGVCHHFAADRDFESFRLHAARNAPAVAAMYCGAPARLSAVPSAAPTMMEIP